MAGNEEGYEVCRVSEMLEVIEKASKLHAENALHKCLEETRSQEASTANAIVFKDVRTDPRLFLPLTSELPLGMRMCALAGK